MTTLRQAAQMALEAMKEFDYDKRMAAIEAVEQALAEPQHQWVGLTKDEVNSWELPDCPTVFEFAQFIEAKLREKNT